MNRRVEIPGPVAQNKDAAREIRRTYVLPAVRGGDQLRIDFSNVTITTQSFVHALISEAVQAHGDAALELLEFHRCSPQVAEAIETVVVYSLRARKLSQQLIPSHTAIGSVDVPQADDLGKVRRVIEAVSDGPLPVEDVAQETGYSIRHAHYRLNAARVLGLVRMFAGIVLITDTGLRLVGTRPGGEEERDMFRRAVAESDILGRLAPRLLTSRRPDADAITSRIVRLARLAPSTAARRANCLLSWRKQLLERQLQLPMMAEPEHDEQHHAGARKRST